MSLPSVLQIAAGDIMYIICRTRFALHSCNSLIVASLSRFPLPQFPPTVHKNTAAYSRPCHNVIQITNKKTIQTDQYQTGMLGCEQQRVCIGETQHKVAKKVE